MGLTHDAALTSTTARLSTTADSLVSSDLITRDSSSSCVMGACCSASPLIPAHARDETTTTLEKRTTLPPIPSAEKRVQEDAGTADTLSRTSSSSSSSSSSSPPNSRSPSRFSPVSTSSSSNSPRDSSPSTGSPPRTLSPIKNKGGPLKRSASFSFSDRFAITSQQIGPTASSIHSDTSSLATTIMGATSGTARPSDQQRRVSLLRESFFGGISHPALVALAEVAQDISFVQGEILFRAGDAADHLLVLVSRSAIVTVDAATNSGRLSPGSPHRVVALGQLPPPIASSAFAAARARAAATATAHHRRHSTPSPTPTPLAPIRESPVTPLALHSHVARLDEVPPVQAEEDKSAASSPRGDDVSETHFVTKHFGSIIGCEGMVNGTAIVRQAGALVRRTYTARARSKETVKALRVSYEDLRTRVLPFLARTARASVPLGDTLMRTLVQRELEGMPVRQPAPTLATILQRETSDTARDEEDATAPARTHTYACKYTDSDLLLHPLFQKVFYVFCKTESTHELLEFWRDCVNFRNCYNKHQLCGVEEARILHAAYILPAAAKFQRHLSPSVIDIINRQVSLFNRPCGTRVETDRCIVNRSLFLEAERVTEIRLTTGSLCAFKRTAGFAKILPFVKLDPRARMRNEAARRALRPLRASAMPNANNDASSSPPTIDAPHATTGTTNAHGSVAPVTSKPHQSRNSRLVESNMANKRTVAEERSATVAASGQRA